MIAARLPARRALPGAVLLLWLACASLGAQASAAPRGSLVIVGGGPIPAAIDRRFVELAGGPGKAMIVILPMASATPEQSGAARVRIFQALGARAVSITLDSTNANADSVARLLASATGIWFPGGVQSRLTRALLGTAALDSIRSRHARGAVVGGTSAGAAVMSDPMITGDEKRPGGARPPSDSSDGFMTIDRDNIVTSPGFGLLTGAIVDQHFLRRRRHNRLVSLALERATIGVGIDESTAIVVGPDGRWEVIGDSQAILYDARRARVTSNGAPLGASGVTVHLLPSGARYDPRSGEATLPR